MAEGQPDKARAVLTRKLGWRKVRPEDSDWKFDFPVMGGGLILCQQVRIFEPDGTTRDIWRPVELVD